MLNDTLARTLTAGSSVDAAPSDPCLLVLFGASGDLTRRLLVPTLYNLACDGLLPERFAVLGTALDPLSTDQFRKRMIADLRTFHTRREFDPTIAEMLVRRLNYAPGDFADAAAYSRLADVVAHLESEHRTEGNLLLYLATPPSAFALIAGHLARAGFPRRRGWTRLVIEKPFGHDLASATALNRGLLADWPEDQLFRIDHYLGKETVQNFLAFRFANGIFEPLWSHRYIDHVQITVAETVGVERRGRYYDSTGALRDMVQNHGLQMLACLAMEPPASLGAETVRSEKVRLLQAIRVLEPHEVAGDAVRGQYGAGRQPDGAAASGYRQEPDVDFESRTETFAALRLSIDNDRWQGVPFYLRSGKRLWKRGTEIVVQFRQPARDVFRGMPAADHVGSNQLIFHVQPDEGIELRFHAKAPGPKLTLQNVDMRFDYRDVFEAARGTGYEVLLHHCMAGDATLFPRGDFVEAAWRVVQPVLDAWADVPTPEFPNYPAGSWGPRAASDLITRDGRRWIEVINRDVLEQLPLFRGAGPVFLHALSMMLRPASVSPNEMIVRQGEPGAEMFFLCHGRVEVLDGGGRSLRTLSEGDFFGEMSLLFSQARSASVRALTPCDLFVLSRVDLERVLRGHPEIAEALHEAARLRAAASQAPS